MLTSLTRRFLTEPDPRLLRKFMVNFGWKGMRSVNAFQKRIKRGEYFPAFLFISLTNQCNYTCRGCWVSQTTPPQVMEVDTLDRLITAAKTKGCRFFGLLGGEPLLHKGLFEIIARHPECYFLVFTNGSLLDRECAREFKRLGNVSPLISIEGKERTSDARRGHAGVFGEASAALEACRAERLITGVASSICASNFDELVRESFLRELIKARVHYYWAYVYRPVGPDPAPELALTRDQIVALRRFLVESRRKVPLVIVDAYWDADGNALCPAAVGMGHHITPSGWVEPCPPLQFAADQVITGDDVVKVVTDSRFLAEFREMATAAGRGCVIMQHPERVTQLARNCGATDSSGRGTVADELGRLTPCASHDLGTDAIPETHWMYRLAKKHWFFGFGAYG